MLFALRGVGTRIFTSAPISLVASQLVAVGAKGDYVLFSAQLPGRMHFPQTQEKLIFDKIEISYMIIVVISNENIVKLLHHAFGDAFETITILAQKDSLRIIGSDKNSCIAAEMTLETNKLDKYLCDQFTRFSVLNEDLGYFLGYSTSKYIPSFGAITFHIYDTHLDMTITSPNVCALQRKFLYAVDGIESLPPIVPFDGEPRFVVEDVRLLRLVYMTLKETRKNRVLLDINPEEIIFSSLDGIQVLKVEGTGSGKRSTILSDYTIDAVSKVWELASIKDLKISISEGKLTQFYYTFEGGSLWYVAASSSG